LFIAINRKDQPLPKLTKQDFEALAERAEKLENDTRVPFAGTHAVAQAIVTETVGSISEDPTSSATPTSGRFNAHCIGYICTIESPCSGDLNGSNF
jgi:hypothetical protein